MVKNTLNHLILSKNKTHRFEPKYTLSLRVRTDSIKFISGLSYSLIIIGSSACAFTIEKKSFSLEDTGAGETISGNL